MSENRKNEDNSVVIDSAGSNRSGFVVAIDAFKVDSGISIGELFKRIWTAKLAVIAAGGRRGGLGFWAELLGFTQVRGGNNNCLGRRGRK